MASTNTYFGAGTRATRGLKDASANVTIGDHIDNDQHSVRVITGTSDKVFVDICGAANNTGLTSFLPSLDANQQKTSNAIKLRVDTYSNDDLFLNSYITPALYLSDISEVTGTLAATQDNEGKKLEGAETLPMYFRTVCDDMKSLTANNVTKANRAIRVTLKDAGKIANGMKLSIFTNVDASTVNLGHSVADICFNAVGDSNGSTGTFPQPLVNGGPLGSDEVIPAFSAAMTKNATTATSGDVKVFSSVPLFKNGGAGIDLSSIVFRIREEAVGGSETFATVTIPVAEQNGLMERNADGLYEYAVTTITNVTGKSYRVMTTSVKDKFLIFGYAMQNSTSGLINVDNIAAAITQSTIAVDADASQNGASWKSGTQAKVTFTAPTAAEGPSSIKKYEARWLTKAQAAAMPLTATYGLNFNTVAAAYPNQISINTDICGTTGAPLPEVLLTGLTPSVMTDTSFSDNDTRYGVFVRAYTKDDDGNFVAGKDGTTDLSLTAFLGKTQVMTPTDNNAYSNVSFGFFVSGVPDAPTHIAVNTGKDLLQGAASNTTTQGLQDISMANNLLVAFNDYNVNQRGSNYESMRYRIIKASDVQYWPTSAPDASYLQTPNGAANVAFSGNDAKSEQLIIDGAGMHTLAYEGNAWVTRANDLSNGTTFAIQYALDNSNGMGYRTAWHNFVPSGHADTSAGLFSLDPSTNIIFGSNGTSSGFGFVARADGQNESSAGGQAGVVENSGQYISMSAAIKAKRYNISQDDGAIGFGFSLLDASGIAAKKAGQPYSTTAELGGTEPTGIRYFVNKSLDPTKSNTTTFVNNTPSRIYGQTHRDISGSLKANGRALELTKAITVPATKDTNRLIADKSYDPSGNLVALKIGQLYDICFSVVNANGYADASMCTLKRFAPMGDIKTVNNLRVGAYPPKMEATIGGAASNTVASFDICFQDMCGAAQHGGHLINRYHTRVTQYQGSVSGEITVFNDLSINEPVTEHFASQFGTVNNDRRKIISTTTATLPGFPLKVTISAEATVSSTGANSIAHENYYHNVGGVAKIGPPVTVTIPGPVYQAATQDDEVKALLVTPGDGKLKVSFYKPQNDAVKDLYQGAPSVNSYIIYQYDMSLSTLGDATATNNSERAMSRTVKVVNDATSLASDYFETELAGVNGKAYVVAVHTQWRYGINNDSLALSKGVYHTNLLSATGVNDVSFAANTGLYTFPIGTNGVRPSNAASLVIANLAIPRGPPTITVTNDSLRFDDNGAEIKSASMIQISPQAGSPSTQLANTTAFFLDLCGTVNSVRIPSTTTITAVPVGGHVTNRKTYDISSTAVLGPNWANEKNFIVIQNDAGSAYVKWNIE